MFNVISHSLLAIIYWWCVLTKGNLIVWTWTSYQLFKKSIIHTVLLFLNNEEIFTLVRKDRWMTPNTPCSEWLYEVFNQSFSNIQVYACRMYSFLFLVHLHTSYAYYTFKHLLRYCLHLVFSESVITPYAAMERIMLSVLCQSSMELQSGA